MVASKRLTSNAWSSEQWTNGIFFTLLDVCGRFLLGYPPSPAALDHVYTCVCVYIHMYVTPRPEIFHNPSSRASPRLCMYILTRDWEKCATLAQTVCSWVAHRTWHFLNTLGFSIELAMVIKIYFPPWYDDHVGNTRAWVHNYLLRKPDRRVLATCTGFMKLALMILNSHASQW